MEQKSLDNLFLSIGAMKAGTTWLYAVLSKHPSLCFSREKEVHFFYNEYENNYILSPKNKQSNVINKYLPMITNNQASVEGLEPGLRWCADYLSEPTDYSWFKKIFPPHAPNAYLCDFSNLTAHLDEGGWRDLSKNVKNLRVLYMLRDPYKRLWSHIKFHLQFSGQIDKLDTWSASDLNNFARQKFIWENSEYGAIISRIKASLPPNSWRVIFYEDVHTNQRNLLRNIESFLGIVHVDYPDSLLKQRPTEGPRRAEPEYFRGLFAADVARICGEMRAQGVPPHPSWEY